MTIAGIALAVSILALAWSVYTRRKIEAAHRQRLAEMRERLSRLYGEDDVEYIMTGKRVTR